MEGAARGGVTPQRVTPQRVAPQRVTPCHTGHNVGQKDRLLSAVSFGHLPVRARSFWEGVKLPFFP